MFMDLLTPASVTLLPHLHCDHLLDGENILKSKSDPPPPHFKNTTTKSWILTLKNASDCTDVEFISHNCEHQVGHAGHTLNSYNSPLFSSLSRNTQLLVAGKACKAIF